MYHSTRSECLVLIKSTIVRSVRATSSSLRSRVACDQQHRVQVPARMGKLLDVVEIAAEPGLGVRKKQALKRISDVSMP